MSDALSLAVLPQRLTICRLPGTASIPGWATAGPFFSISRTADELSVVLPEAALPDGLTGVKRQDGWRALQVAGPLELALTGILASLATPLAGAGVPIFAISTHDTDYILVPESQLAAAVKALRARGHRIPESER